MKIYSFALQVVVLLAAVLTVDGAVLCPKCEKGKFIVRNCTTTDKGNHGIVCLDCKTCDGEGQKIVLDCTDVSDTQCGCEDGYIPSSSTSCQKATTTTTATATSMPVTMLVKKPSSRMHMLGAAPVFLALIVVAFIVGVAMGKCAFFERVGLKFHQSCSLTSTRI